jgi:superfamily I DNA and/or RNA helicase
MSESLFERLSSSEGIITLNLNYRMNKTLTDLANTLTYEGQLQTGNEVVANRTLHIPNMQVTVGLTAPWLVTKCRYRRSRILTNSISG